MTNSLKLIENFYRDKRAERTKIPLINHIYEGLEIMNSLEASELGKSAYCIHPMLQDTSALIENINYCFDNVNSDIIKLAIKYRLAANAFLCKPTTDIYTKEAMINLMTSLELFSNQDLKDALIADKIQNRKDFLLYHYGTHPRSDELNEYFIKWLDVLDVKSTKIMQNKELVLKYKLEYLKQGK